MTKNNGNLAEAGLAPHFVSEFVNSYNSKHGPRRSPRRKSALHCDCRSRRGRGFHVWCPALKGCHSQGETQEEALENIHEAIVAYLDSLQDDGLPLPKDVTIHQVEAAAS